MNQSGLLAFLLNGMNSDPVWEWTEALSGFAIALILLVILIYRELSHRQRIQQRLAETQSTQAVGEAVGILETGSDMSDRKASELARLQSQQQYEALVNSIKGVVWESNPETFQFTFVSPQAEVLLGYSVEQWLTPNFWRDHVFVEDAAKAIETCSEAVKIQADHTMEYRMVNAAGETVWVEDIVRVEIQQGKVTNLRGLILDIRDRKQLEQAWQASEARLKDIFNSAVAAITSLRVFGDGHWQIDQVSAGCELISGYTAEELTQDNYLWIARIEPEDWQAVSPQVFTKVFAEQTHAYEYRLHHKDGSLRWISQTNNSRWDEAQQCWVVTAVSIDITDRKTAELALRQSEATNRALISAVPDLLFRMDHQGTYLDVLGNSTHIKLIKPKSEFIGASVYDVLPYELAQIRMHYIQQALQTNELQVFEYQFEIDGEILDEEARIVVCGEQQVLYMVRDISDRKRVERELQEKENFLQLILDTIPEQIFWKDRQSNYLGCNYLFAKMAGLSNTNDIIGKTDHDFPWESGVADDFRQEDQLILEIGQPLLQIVEQKLYADGQRLWHRINKVPIPDATGSLIGVLGTIEDIHEQKLAEEALRSRHQELLTLHRISEISLKTQSSKAIFQGIVEEISTATGFPMVEIELYDRERQVMVFEGIKGLEMGDKVLEVPVAQSLSGTVAQTGQAIVQHHGPNGCEECADHEDLKHLHIRTFVCMPMLINQDAIGVLSLAHPEVFEVDQDTLRWIESLANYLALVTHRQQLEASLQQANADLELQVADQTLELREVIAQLEQEICDRQQTEAALKQSEEQFRQIFEFAPIGISLARLSDYRMVRSNQMYCRMLGYTDAEMSTLSFTDVTHPEDLAIELPLLTRLINGEIPVLQLEKRYLRKDGHIRWALLTATLLRDAEGNPLYSSGMLEDITDRRQAQFELQEAHKKLTCWVSDLEQRHQEITLLNEMSDLLQACLTVDEAYLVMAQFMPRLFLDCSGAIYRLGDSKGLVEAVTTWGEAIASPLFNTNDCFALRRGQPHYVQNTHNSLCCKHLPIPLPTSYFCVPMVAQGETSGVLFISLPRQAIAESTQQLATTVARQIALAIANLKLYTTLQNQSICDPLTGLYNRRYLNEFLERELRRAERYQQCLSVILIDVDHFKQFNDTFGHDAGDAVLRSLSQFLQTNVRNSDIACRYGGEELVLILPNTPLADAGNRAEQLRQGIKVLTVEYPQSLGTITVSLGVACFPAHGTSALALLQAADTVLYQAKAAGRDRVAQALPLHPMPPPPPL